jgi:hypothetical protein
MPSAISPLIDAIRDNGSPHGIADVNLASGPTILVPWREGHYTTSGTVITGAVGGADNGDGSNTYIQFQPGSSVPLGSINYIKHMFYGTSYGVRFDPIFTSGGGGLFEFCVIIDRVAYRVTKARYHDDTLAAWDIQGNAMHNAIVVRDLPDGPHIAEINVVPNVTTNGQRFFGFLADSKYYRAYPPKGYPNTPATLTTAYTQVSLATVARFRGLGMRGILYANTDVTARIVTVRYGAQGAGTVIWVKTIPANDSAVFDPLTVLGIDSNAAATQGAFEHKADANSVVQATVIAGQ